MRLLLFMAALWCATGGGCAVTTEPGGSLVRFESTRICMGVQTRIVVYANGRELAEAAMGRAFAEMARLDGMMSDYRPTSELSRLGEGAPAWMGVSEEMVRVLEAAREVSAATGGAFDVTVGPAVAVWREARRAGQLPTAGAIAAARELIDWRRVEADASQNRARLAVRGMGLDFGGIAKGYAAAHAADVLRKEGLGRCLVAMAGDIATGDAPPGEAGWRVEVRPGACGAETMTLLVSNASVSTSGDEEQFVEIGGRRYSHVVDPRTGLGITTRRAACVVSERGEIADALSTALCAMEETAERERAVRRWARTGAIVFEDGGPARVIDPEGVVRAAR